MAEETKKVYTALVDFEHDGVSYKAKEKYELTDAVVKALPEGNVKEYVVPTQETGAVSDKPDNQTTPKEDEKKEEATPATPWVGNHTVGRD